MVFVTGYIVFHNTSQLVSNDAACFENSMAYFEERGFDYSGLLETFIMEKVALTSSYDGHTIPAELIYANSKNNDDMARLNMSGMNIGIPLDFLMLSADIYYQLTPGFSYSKASTENA